MTELERKASFYLGKAYDLERQSIQHDQPILYDARDLTTHAVCIGMTGSGKTGLGVTLLEEAALDGIPSIVIDPKGDMTNLLLTFPELRPKDFEPWVNVDDARRKGLSVSEYAASIARLWRKGLEEWGQSPERIRRLQDAADFCIYTPGSKAGIPVSLLQAFRPPALDWDAHEDELREAIADTASGLLALVDIEADPLQSREHILLSHIFEHAWRGGRELSLPDLIQAIQNPPIDTLGVFSLDTFYPRDDRFQLAMTINRLIAAPSFASWLEGMPLDISQIIRTPEGKPRVAIFYIAHLNEAERLFFVTLLLQQVIGWMRRLSGTTSLRCLLYFDEVFGYFPPHPANPPTKRPILTLLKMARAFGVGVMLTTQNPVDLDYKGLTNAGTWFIGKLQTDRDKMRVLEGMTGVVTEFGTTLDRSYLDRAISSLGSRVFLLHNVHNDRPILYHTRWAMSYLRGPLTRAQVQQLMASQGRLNDQKTPQPKSPLPQRGQSVSPPPTRFLEGYIPSPPRVHARVAQYFGQIDIPRERAELALTRQLGARPDTTSIRLVYEPFLLGVAEVRYLSQATSTSQRFTCLLPLPEGPKVIEWEPWTNDGFDAEMLSDSPYNDALYATLPEGMTSSPPYTQFRRDWVNYLYHEKTLQAFQNNRLRIRSKIGEDRQEFALRCQQVAETKMNAEITRVQSSYEKKIATLRDRLDREERELEQDRTEYEGRKQEELLSAGESLLSMFLGRRRSTLISSASRRRRLTAQAKADVKESEETIKALQQDINKLEQDRDRALEQIRQEWREAAQAIDQVAIRPRKSDIEVEMFGIAWMPFWLIAYRVQNKDAYLKIPASRYTRHDPKQTL